MRCDLLRHVASWPNWPSLFSVTLRATIVIPSHSESKTLLVLDARCCLLVKFSGKPRSLGEKMNLLENGYE